METLKLYNGKFCIGTKIITKNSKEYDFIGDFENGFASVRLNDKCGFIDITGKEVIECKYDYTDYYFTANGFSRVKLNDKWGVIDTTGKEVVECKYKNLSDTQEALEKLSKN